MGLAAVHTFYREVGQDKKGRLDAMMLGVPVSHLAPGCTRRRASSLTRDHVCVCVCLCDIDGPRRPRRWLHCLPIVITFFVPTVLAAHVPFPGLRVPPALFL